MFDIVKKRESRYIEKISLNRKSFKLHLTQFDINALKHAHASRIVCWVILVPTEQQRRFRSSSKTTFSGLEPVFQSPNELFHDCFMIGGEILIVMNYQPKKIFYKIQILLFLVVAHDTLSR